MDRYPTKEQLKKDEIDILDLVYVCNDCDEKYEKISRSTYVSCVASCFCVSFSIFALAIGLNFATFFPY